MKKHLKKILAITLLGCGSTLFGLGDGWLLNIDTAMEQAKAENKLVLIGFHGSDWCPPCIKLSKEVIATDEFKALASEKLILVDADFPRRKELPEAQREHNQSLAQKHSVEGLPTLVLMSADGKVVDRLVGFPRGGLKAIEAMIAKAPAKND